LLTRQCPIDTRVELARSLLLVGGTTALPGFAPRLLAQINALVGQRYHALRALQGEFRCLATAPFLSTTLTWTGAAIAAARDSEQWITQAFYKSNAKNLHLPDWTSLRGELSSY